MLSQQSSCCWAEGCEQKQQCSTNKQMDRCSRCKVSRYCSAAHQKDDWTRHKQCCKKLLAARGDLELQKQIIATVYGTAPDANQHQQQPAPTTTSSTQQKSTTGTPPPPTPQTTSPCCICFEPLPRDGALYVLETCCGAGQHLRCAAAAAASSKTSNKTKTNRKCPQCSAVRCKTNSKKTLKGIKKWAEKGHSWAQSLYAQRLQFGQGVPKSMDKAIDWYLLAAEQGEPGAQLNVGMFYYNGVGKFERSLVNVQKGRKYITLAAQQGLESAILCLRNIDARQGITTEIKIEPTCCSACGVNRDATKGIALTGCTRCQACFYCSAKCRNEHWIGLRMYGPNVEPHKTICCKK